MFKAVAGLIVSTAVSASNASLDGGTISNSVISIGIDKQYGGSISSFKVLGVEVVDTADLGREIQASVFLEKPTLNWSNRPDCEGKNDAPWWFNPKMVVTIVIIHQK
ncbi:hypothetical protein [Zooshikella ganghwensis]|uniref:Uncharacterized protein n=1 Tax=Zooshikella ganghwensis TaxID=202772 RepID=A0A4P9VSH1_9GAMM|nr:hypothetical protein [Zooshikella ganghwensis]RDH45172.1 hypothetical protein B9G39_17955 [Zooshikella ganghwensis]